MFVPSIEEFSVGNARNASTAAGMKNGINVNFVPYCALEFIFGFGARYGHVGHVRFVHGIHMWRHAL